MHKVTTRPLIHPNVYGNLSPSPEKDPAPSDVRNHMVFSPQCPDLYCTPAQVQTYNLYMQDLGMEHWVTVDQCNRPAGDSCIGNETSTSMYAFEGTMREYNDQGHSTKTNQGSGHLGPSYVGVASVREGRGVMNPAALPTLQRMI